LRNVLWAGVGFIFLGLGILGAFLPVMPTTIFLILAAWAFAQSHPAWKDWIFNHPKFGSNVRLWFEHGAIPRHIKRLAIGMMALSYGITVWLVSNLWVLLAVGACLAAVSLFIVTRRETPGD
jgi:hypothetical protein